MENIRCFAPWPSICIFYSVEEYLKDSSAPISAPCLKQHLLKQCNNEKLIDNPEAVPFFTIERVVDYLINRKEQDSMRAEDWKNFKTGGYKLFKEAMCKSSWLVSKIQSLELNATAYLKCRRNVYINWRLISLLLGLMYAVHSVIVLQVEVCVAVVNTLQQHFLFLKIFILLMKKFRHLPMIMMCPAHQNYRLGTNQGKGD